MKVTYSWLKDFVELRMSPEALGERLTMAGLSVASLARAGSDWVYDIEVTSNRPDWLSVEGIAREAAAVTKSKLKKIVTASPGRLRPGSARKKRGTRKEEKGKKSKGRLTVRVEDKKGCPLYCAALITGVRVGASPAWLTERLESVGQRSVNNIVDVTNYCLLQAGQPLHAFDFGKIAGAGVAARRAKAGETLYLIDGSAKKLTPDILVIADGKQPVAVAGVMGGAETEVCETTTDILLESACFDAALVRRASRLLGVATDSSYRFERGVELSGVRHGLEEACRLICELAGGDLSDVVAVGQPASGRETKKIIFDFPGSRDMLGIDISEKEALGILQRLGFAVSRLPARRGGPAGKAGKKKGIFEVAPPAHRRDVRIEADVAEELVRVFGYDRIKTTAPSIKPFALPQSVRHRVVSTARGRLVGFGLKEVIAYSLVGAGEYRKISQEVPAEALVLENPLSQDNCFLRTTLAPCLLECLSFNAGRGRKDLEIFEISSVSDSRGERLVLGIALAGLRRASWRKESSVYTFFDLKGIVEALGADCGIDGFDFKAPAAASFLSPGEACDIFLGPASLGYLGKVREETKRAFGIKGKEDVFVAELCLDALAARARPGKIFTPFPMTPGVTRDISMVVDREAAYGAIRRLIEEEASGCLRGVAVVERYAGEALPAGTSGLCVSVEYGAQDRTLSDEEVSTVHQKILARLTGELSVILR